MTGCPENGEAPSVSAAGRINGLASALARLYPTSEFAMVFVTAGMRGTWKRPSLLAGASACNGRPTYDPNDYGSLTGASRGSFNRNSIPTISFQLAVEVYYRSERLAR